MTGRLISLFILVLGLSLSGTQAAQAGTADRAFDRARNELQQVQKSPKKRQFRDQWEHVIASLDSAAARYPDHARAAEARFLIGQAWEGRYDVSQVKDDARQAVNAYAQMAERYPNSTKCSAALLRAARLSDSVTNEYTQAYGFYYRFLERSRKGDPDAPAVRKRLKTLAPYAPKAATAAAPRDNSRTTLSRIRFWSNPGYTRVVLDLTRAVTFSSNLLPAEGGSAPPRLYIDLPDTTPGNAIPELRLVEDGLLRQIRAGRPDQGRSRIVFDLQSFKDFKIFTLNEPFRIVVDINGSRPGEPAVAVATTPLSGNLAPAPPPATPLPSTAPTAAAVAATPEPPAAVPPPAVTTGTPLAPPIVPPPAGTSDRISTLIADAPRDNAAPTVQIAPAAVSGKLQRIVVDAGHGGKDPGAIGPGRTQEKDLTLAMARMLKTKLEKELRCEIIMTRDSDIFIPLEERTAIANKVGADLFVSIHVNASPNKDARGIETYYLNFSKNEKAAAVAARENGTTLKQVGDLELILFDLMAHSKIEESSRLAHDIQRSLIGHLSKFYEPVRDLGVREGPFYVLLGANMPSVLVETAFISNRAEESRINSKHYQERSVEAIAAGIRSYATALNLLAKQ